MTQNPNLYIKEHCPWGKAAMTFFAEKDLSLNIRDVEKDAAAFQHMVEISGQRLTPTFEHEGFVVADFSIDEFKAALDKTPEKKKALVLQAS